MEDAYQKLRREKTEDDRYREAAVRLTGGYVHSLATVVRDAERDGAFVEVVVWVPKEAIGE